MPDFLDSAKVEPTPKVDSETKSPNSESLDKSVFLEHGGRKFTKEELIKKLDHADGFIETLKGENKQRDELLEKAAEALKKQSDMAEVLATLKANPQTKEPDKVSEERIEFDATSFAAGLKKDVLDTISAAEKAKKEDDNWKNVTSKLNAIFKDKVNDAVAKAAAENDLSVDEAAKMAREKPALFLKMFPELNPKAPATLDLANGRRPNLFDAGHKAVAKSGYAEAKSSTAKVEAYLKRLAELSG